MTMGHIEESCLIRCNERIIWMSDISLYDGINDIGEDWIGSYDVVNIKRNTIVLRCELVETSLVNSSRFNS